MNAALLLLVDGRFPAGGHTNSAGVEAAIQAGDVVDEATLERYLCGRLATTGVTEAAFAAHVMGLASAPIADQRTLVVGADAEYEARVLSPHLRTVSRRFGRQLARVGRPIWSHPLVDALDAVPGGAHQPIVLGALVAAAGGSPADAAAIAMHHLAAAVTTAGVRLLGLDPLAVAAMQARAGVVADELRSDAEGWATLPAASLPADGGSLTEILAEDHGHWNARLFVA